MGMHHCLACGHTIVQADVEAVWPVFSKQLQSHFSDQLPDCSLPLGGPRRYYSRVFAER